jgi:tetratricopeptide (TPR) repeat protein
MSMPDPLQGTGWNTIPAGTTRTLTGNSLGLISRDSRHGLEAGRYRLHIQYARVVGADTDDEYGIDKKLEFTVRERLAGTGDERRIVDLIREDVRGGRRDYHRDIAYPDAAARILLFHSGSDMAPHAWYWLGVTEEERGRYKHAVWCYEKLLTLDPDYPINEAIRFYRLRALVKREKLPFAAAADRARQLLETTSDIYARSSLEGYIERMEREARSLKELQKELKEAGIGLDDAEGEE